MSHRFVLALGLVALLAQACTVNRAPAGESRALNEGLVRCGHGEEGETNRCDLEAGEVCCIDGAERMCLDADACGSTALHCDDPTDCPPGEICCGDIGVSQCKPASECGGAQSCVTDWNCHSGQICRENFFVSDIYLCDGAP